MAVSATFAADFSSFEAAIAKADVKIRGLDTSSKFVERSLSRMTDNFSGRKLIQEATLMVDAIDRIGGKSKLTETELQTLGNKAAEAAEKMRKMGVEVPAKLDDLAKSAQKPVGVFKELLGVIGKIGPALGVSLGVGTIINFAKGIGEFSGKMVDLNAQTQISTNRLQAFNLVGAGVGLTIEDIAGSADQLAKRIGGGDDSVVSALGKMKLKADDLKNLGLDEVIFEIDKGLRGVSNQFERARILSDLFGRSGAQLGRLMDGSLKEAVTAVEKTGAVIDEELLRKADAFDDAWSQAWIKFRAYAVTAIGGVKGEINDLFRFMSERLPGFGGFGGTKERQAVTDAALNRLRGTLRPQRTGIGGPDTSIVEGGGIKSVIEESELSKNLREWSEKTREAAEATASWARNLQGEFSMQQDIALFHSVTSEATKKLRDLAMRAGLPGLGAGSEGVIQSQQNALFQALGISARPGAVSGGSASGGTGFLQNVKGNLSKSFGGVQGIGAGLAILGQVIGPGQGKGRGALSGAMTGAGIGTMIMPGIGTAIGAGIGGLVGLFRGKGAEGKATNRMRDQAIAELTGISGDKFGSQEAFRKMAMDAGIASAELDKLFSTKRTKDFESSLASIQARIGTFTDEREADQARLTAAIEKYGFTIEQLGPALQKQRLDEQAKELIEDWRVLVGAGVDISTVNEQMSEAINEYLQTAVRLGTEVPAAMRPVLQKMLEQGKLTDEAGNAITDMEAAGIRFSETMTEGFDRVVKKLDELISKLIAAGDAANSLDTSGMVEPRVPGPDDFAGPRVPGPEDLVPVPMAAGGSGRVYKPTLFLAGERGPEEFAFSGANKGFGGGGDVVAAIEGLQSDLARYIEGTQRVMRDQMAIALGRSA